MVESPPRHRANADDSATAYIRGGLFGVGLFVLVLLVGGAALPLDAAVTGPGRVVVSGQRQSVQHLDGGIVARLNVRDGQTVSAGDVLMQVEVGELEAELEVLARQSMDTRFREARMQATIDGDETLARPAWVDAGGNSQALRLSAVYEIHRAEFETDTQAYRIEISVLDDRARQTQAALRAATAELNATREQQQLVSEQLDSLDALLEKGFATQTRVRSLKTDKARLDGQVLSLESTLEEHRSAIAEIGEQRRLAAAQRQTRAARELREARTERLSIEPRIADLEGRIKRADVRAPVSGQVIALSVFTEGAVVAPGQVLMEIVPANAGLVIEASIQPRDASSVSIGNTAKVELAVSNARNAPRLDGVVIGLSPDQIIDEATGMGYFKAEIEIPADALEQLPGVQRAVGPGMPVFAVIPTRGRTALGYLLDPLNSTIWRNMREQPPRPTNESRQY